MDNRTAGRTALAVLGLCFVLTVLSRGVNESFTVFLLPISQGFGWDRAEVISIYSLSALTSGLAAPLIGRLFDRAGPRAVYGLGLLLIGAALTVAGYAQQLWQLQLCIGVVVGFASACLGNVTGSLLLARWFGPRLPTAMAVIYSAMGAGALVALPVSQLLIDAYGWRGAYQILGGVALAIFVPFFLLPMTPLLWRRVSEGSPHLPKHNVAQSGDQNWTLGSAIRHHAFWALFSTFFFTAIGIFAITAQVVAYLVDAGFPPLQAATAWGFSGVLLLFGMLTISWLDGVIGRRRSILLSYSLTISGIVLLYYLQYFPNWWLLAGFVVCFGGTQGSRGPLITATAMRIFRGKRVGTIFGTISIGSGLGAALGSWSGGLLHDWTGGYNAVLGFALVSIVVGMIPFLTVPMLRR